ncbi:MAG: hypothetical protein KIT44_10840 [Opitutaceae bacterium]|nr:hypothetical protein [Opitutaceae bacterium]
MKSIRCLLAALLFTAGLTPLGAQSERASVRAILVAASNAEGESDRRLAPFEPTLRRILRFQSYRYLGEGSATVTTGGTVNLGQGHRLELEHEPGDGRAVRLRVNWLDGRRSLMQTGLVLRPGVPAVLGGPARGDGEVYAVIVIGR